MAENTIQKFKYPLCFLVISILLEVFVFNYRHIFSINAANQDIDFVSVAGNTVYAENIVIPGGYLYVDVSAYTEDGTTVPVTLDIIIQDEGNSNDYELPQVTLYPLIEKSKYLNISSYGNINKIIINMSTDADNADITLSRMISDAKVPWFISIPRILLIFILCMLIWCLRPASSLYRHIYSKREKSIIITALIVANVSVFFIFVRMNPAFFNPVWPYHQQYYKLAQSLAEGRVSIDVGNEEIKSSIMAMDNPYDYNSRQENVPGYDQVWDICYYNGNFYVYFGVVPALIFYLPWYLMFNSAFPTWLGVFIMGALSVCGMYYLISRICHRWFKNVPFILYIILAATAANSLNLYPAMLHADFYYLPIVSALCFTVWGLGFAISAIEMLKETSYAYIKNDENAIRKNRRGVNIRLVAGGLCLALTAGCRPQFLVASFLLIPLFVPAYVDYVKACHNNGKNNTVKDILCNAAALAVPYILVAAGLMYYNYIRFGSAFDFGASYNLTTNDMTKRGFYIERLVDGIFMYLFQPVSLKPYFPFVEIEPFYSKYLGGTIRDWTFGGAFCTHMIFMAVPAVFCVKKELKQKKLFAFSLLASLFAFVIVAADTEMAGILGRYYMDFQWLMAIAAVVIILQLLEKYRGLEIHRLIMWFVIITGLAGMLFEIFASFRGSGIINDNTHRYYLIKSLFEL